MPQFSLATETVGIDIGAVVIVIPPPPFVLCALPTARKQVQTKGFDRESFCLWSIADEGRNRSYA
jgi:hypothetical protein